jgi:hypothetical protein
MSSVYDMHYNQSNMGGSREVSCQLSSGHIKHTLIHFSLPWPAITVEKSNENRYGRRSCDEKK